jgi:hypothetical protein
MDLRATWIELNRPGLEKFRQELRRLGKSVPKEELEQFYRAQTSKQLFAPGPRYTGHIVGLGFKWAADFMQMKDNSKWLVVQDITSREAWVSRDSAVSAFSSILERADSLPKVLVTDADPIFTSKVFQEMLRERDILHTIRQGRQDLATVDNLIARIKRVAAQEELEGGKVDIPQIVEQFNKTGAKVLARMGGGAGYRGQRPPGQHTPSEAAAGRSLQDPRQTRQQEGH